MGLFFGGKDDSKQKIEELKAKMQGGQPQQWQQPQQPWQAPQQEYQPPQQTWQPPRDQGSSQPAAQAPPTTSTSTSSYSSSSYDDAGSFDESKGLVLDLGDGMSLNLPVKSRMRLDEFLRIADRVRELKKIEHHQQY